MRWTYEKKTFRMLVLSAVVLMGFCGASHANLWGDECNLEQFVGDDENPYRQSREQVEQESQALEEALRGNAQPQEAEPASEVARNQTNQNEITQAYDELVSRGILNPDGSAHRQRRSRNARKAIEERDNLVRHIHALADEGLFDPKNKLSVAEAIKAVELLDRMREAGVRIPSPDEKVKVRTRDGKIEEMKFSEWVKSKVQGVGDFVGDIVSKPFVLFDFGSAAFNGTKDFMFRPRTLWQNSLNVSMAMAYPFVSPFKLGGSMYQSYKKWRYGNWHWDKHKRPDQLYVKNGRLKSATLSLLTGPTMYFVRDAPWLGLYALLHANNANPLYYLNDMVEEDGLTDVEFDELAGSPDDNPEELTLMINLHPNADKSEEGSVAELGEIILRDEDNIEYEALEYPQQIELALKRFKEKHGHPPKNVFIYAPDSNSGKLKFPKKMADREYFARREPIDGDLVAPDAKIVIKAGRIGSDSTSESGESFLKEFGNYLLPDGGTVVAPVRKVGNKQRGVSWNYGSDENNYGFVQGPATAVWEIGENAVHRLKNMKAPGDIDEAADKLGTDSPIVGVDKIRAIKIKDR